MGNRLQALIALAVIFGFCALVGVGIGNANYWYRTRFKPGLEQEVRFTDLAAHSPDYDATVFSHFPGTVTAVCTVSVHGEAGMPPTPVESSDSFNLSISSGQLLHHHGSLGSTTGGEIQITDTKPTMTCSEVGR